MNELTTHAHSRSMTAGASIQEQVFVTIYVEKQLFGIPVERVQDILIPQTIANIPLAPPEIEGAINLRGRIVTVVDVRTRLGLKPMQDGAKRICVTVEQGHELYSLLVDNVGAVITLRKDKIDTNPTTLEPRWRSISSGVVRLEKEIMIVMDIDDLLHFS